MRIIEPLTTEDLHSYYDLRWRLLRAPWRQPRGSERDAQDADSIHLMLVDDRNLPLAVGRLHLLNEHEAQIRYMAVEIMHQRAGLGGRLLQALEQRAVTLGASRIVLDARDTALDFYRRHGYAIDGDSHVLFNSVAHIKMSKLLQAGPDTAS